MEFSISGLRRVLLDFYHTKQRLVMAIVVDKRSLLQEDKVEGWGDTGSGIDIWNSGVRYRWEVSCQVHGIGQNTARRLEFPFGILQQHGAFGYKWVPNLPVRPQYFLVLPIWIEAILAFQNPVTKGPKAAVRSENFGANDEKMQLLQSLPLFNLLDTNPICFEFQVAIFPELSAFYLAHHWATASIYWHWTIPAWDWVGPFHPHE